MHALRKCLHLSKRYHPELSAIQYKKQLLFPCKMIHYLFVYRKLIPFMNVIMNNNYTLQPNSLAIRLTCNTKASSGLFSLMLSISVAAQRYICSILPYPLSKSLAYFMQFPTVGASCKIIRISESSQGFLLFTLFLLSSFSF